MKVEAANKGLIELIKCEGKEFQRMQPTLQKQFLRTISLLLAAESINDLKAFRTLDHKFYNGFHQVRVDGDKRIWFTEGPDGIIIENFDEGNH